MKDQLKTIREALEIFESVAAGPYSTSKALAALTAHSELERMAGEPGVMVDMVPPATARDRWMYEQGRLAERDPRTYAAPPAQQPHECTRSHPHENMDGYCVLRTEIARLTNENARLKAQQPQAEAVPVLTDSQIMASVGRNAGGPDTSISESRPLGQQWTQICALVRHIIRERYCGVAPQQAEAVPKTEVIAAVDRLVRSAWEWGEGCGVDNVSWGEAGDSHNEGQRSDVELAKRNLLSLLAPQQAEAVPQPIARKFESMHARGDVWITTLAAAAIAAQGEKP